MSLWTKIRKKVVGTAAGIVGGIFAGPAGAAAASSAVGSLMAGGGGGGGGGGTAAPIDPPPPTVSEPGESGGQATSKGGGMQGVLNWIKANPIMLAVGVVVAFVAFKFLKGKRRGGR